jgi:GcrA cell cycle regulator
VRPPKKLRSAGYSNSGRGQSKKVGVANPFVVLRVWVYKPSPMEWNASEVALLTALWTKGHSAAQIARRLGYSRNAVCAKLTRLGLKGGHKPPTANPTIRPVPKRRPALLAACARPVEKVVSQKRVTRQPKEFTKRPGECRETK